MTEYKYCSCDRCGRNSKEEQRQQQYREEQWGGQTYRFPINQIFDPSNLNPCVEGNSILTPEEQQQLEQEDEAKTEVVRAGAAAAATQEEEQRQQQQSLPQ